MPGRRFWCFFYGWSNLMSVLSSEAEGPGLGSNCVTLVLVRREPPWHKAWLAKSPEVLCESVQELLPWNVLPSAALVQYEGEVTSQCLVRDGAASLTQCHLSCTLRVSFSEEKNDMVVSQEIAVTVESYNCKCLMLSAIWVAVHTSISLVICIFLVLDLASFSRGLQMSLFCKEKCHDISFWEAENPEQPAVTVEVLRYQRWNLPMWKSPGCCPGIARFSSAA